MKDKNQQRIYATIGGHESRQETRELAHWVQLDEEVRTIASKLIKHLLAEEGKKDPAHVDEKRVRSLIETYGFVRSWSADLWLHHSSLRDGRGLQWYNSEPSFDVKGEDLVEDE